MFRSAACLLLLCSTFCRYGDREKIEESILRDAILAELLADAAGACVKTGNVVSVRATSSLTQTRCDLLDGSLVSDGSLRWDIAFQRFKISTASGSSAGASGGACRTGITSFDSVGSVSLGATAPPDCPHFAVDETLSAESGGAQGSSTSSYSGNPVLQQWYNYNIFGHTLSAKPDVYVIRSSDGARFYKLQMLDYYSAAGTSGYPKFRFEEIPL
jgi:hypothetical protein